MLAQDGTPVVVTATAREWPVALNQALARAAEMLKRLFKRHWQARRAERRFAREERHPA